MEIIQPLTDEINVHVKVHSGRMEEFINEYYVYNNQLEKQVPSSVIDSDVIVQPTVFNGLGLADENSTTEPPTQWAGSGSCEGPSAQRL